MKKIFDIFKNILISLLIVILLFVAIIVIISFIQIDIQGKEYCNIFGYSIFQIETGSMSPELEIEDIIIVKLGNDNLNVNDIITFRQDENLVTHRIMKIEDKLITTKGDGNNSEDEPITKENVIAKTVKTFNEVAIWKKVFAEPRVLISIIITVVLLVLLVSYKEKVGEKNV